MRLVWQVPTLDKALDSGAMDLLLDPKEAANAVERAVVGRRTETARRDHDIGPALQRIIEGADHLIIVVGQTEYPPRPGAELGKLLGDPERVGVVNASHDQLGADGKQFYVPRDV